MITLADELDVRALQDRLPDLDRAALQRVLDHLHRQIEALKDRDERYAQGFAAGRGVGMDAGRQLGYDTGYAVGLEEGRRQAIPAHEL